MKRGIAFFAAMLCLFFVVSTSYEAQSSPISVQIVNNSGVAADNVWVLLTADQLSSIVANGITPGKSTQLSAITNSQFTLSAISAGRVQFSFNGAVPANQQPLTPSARFDKVEVTYPGVADLTSVDFFGIPMKLETLDASGNVLQTLTFYTSKNTLAGTLTSLAPGALVNTAASNGSFARILSPSLKPSAYPSMQKYVNSVAGQNVTISGTYMGKIGPTPNTYNYTGTFNKADSTLTLTGTLSAIPASQPLTVQGNTLASAVYTNNGVYSVGKTPQQVSANDVYAAIYRDMIAGFDFGYMGGRYGSNSGSWYGTTPYHMPYAGARKTSDGYFNQYASIITANSDAYGFPFMDVNQKVTVDLNSGTSTNVATLRITILPDNMIDAPIIKSASSGNSTINVSWAPVRGATGYAVQVSPPIGAKPISTGGKTSCAIQKLNQGTPYTVAVTASNGASNSEAIPVIISTKGQATPVQGQATWNFVSFFTGSFPGHKVSFNGQTKNMPQGSNPSIPFYNVQGQPGQQNAYVFTWTDQNGGLVFSTIMYVTLDSKLNPTVITQAPSKTFMASNQYTPTYDSYGFNLYVSIAPYIQRTFVTSTSLFEPDPDPMQFGTMVAVKIGKQKTLHLKGTVVDDDGLRGVSVTVTTGNGRTTVYPATVTGTNWTATIETFGSRKLQVVVTGMDKKGNVVTKSYAVKI